MAETADLAALQALAEGATPRPWSYLAYGEKDNSWGIGVFQYEDGTTCTDSVNDEDAERYLAAGEPDEWDGALCSEPVCENTASMANLSDAAFIVALVNAWPSLSAELAAAREVVEAAAAFAGKQVSVDVTEIIEQVVRDVGNGLEPDMDNAVRWTAYALQESDEAFALNKALDAYRAAAAPPGAPREESRATSTRHIWPKWTRWSS